MPDEANGERLDGIERRSVLKGIGMGSTLSGVPWGGGGSGHTDSDAGGQRRSFTGARNRWYSTQAVVDETECFRPNEREVYGPTDINAQTANGRLAVGLNNEGTVTVVRWPRPSFYDQIKYFTRGRHADDSIDVPPNQGAFLGLALLGPDESDGGYETIWLRDMVVEHQQYRNDVDLDAKPAFSDEVITTYTSERHDVRVVVRDLVPVGGRMDETASEHGAPAGQADALVRRVRVVWQGPPADRPQMKLLAYENVNLVVSKHPQYPVQDWCSEESNDDYARYDPGLDGVVHSKAGVDESTGDRQSVAIAMGFGGDSIGHQVGADGYDPVSPAGRALPSRDAYIDASDGSLSGTDKYAGQTTGALATDLSFRGTVAREQVVFTAAHTPARAGEHLETLRATRFGVLRDAKERWLGDLLADAPMPDTTDVSVVKLARRALVTLVTDYDPLNGAIVASIATQAPYGEDWPRDGAYFNYVLDILGLDDWVAARNRWYADIQQRGTDPRPSHPNTPPGNWAMDYYGDGVAGGPIPYEIDETAYTIWTLWNHYQSSGDEGYLVDVYPAIRRAGDYLVECLDPSTGLHCVAWEDDRFVPSQTIVGAATTWLGLEAARKAAMTVATEDTARYEARQHELGRAIDEHLYSTEAGAYGLTDGGIGFPMPEVVWPVCFTPYADPETGAVTDRPQVDNPFDHPRIQHHLDAVWRTVSPAFDAGTDAATATTPTTGQYEVKALLPLMQARRSAGALGTQSAGTWDVERGLEWIADEHATDDTHVMGEAWTVFTDDAVPNEAVRSIVSQPHAWEQVLTYLAALEVWPPEDGPRPSNSCGGVVDELHDR